MRCLWLRTRLFVDLNGGLVVIDSDDFTDQTVISDFDLLLLVCGAVSQGVRETYELVHGDTNHVLGDDDGTGWELASWRRWTGGGDVPRHGEDGAWYGSACAALYDKLTGRTHPAGTRHLLREPLLLLA